jgi:hypothetical protein
MGPSVCLKHSAGSDALVASIDTAQLPRPPEATVVLMNPGPAGIANEELPRPPECTEVAYAKPSSRQAVIGDITGGHRPGLACGNVGGGKLALGPNLTSFPPWTGFERCNSQARWAAIPEADDIGDEELPRPPEEVAEEDSELRSCLSVVQERQLSLLGKTLSVPWHNCDRSNALRPTTSRMLASSLE